MSSGGKQLDLSKLLNAKRGIESDKITERKVSRYNSSLLEEPVRP